jgi:adenine-specific DNA methylase
MRVRPLIEQWFPAATIGAESLRERGASSALPPINFLHVWWARRPLTTSRAAIVGSLLPSWPTEEEATDPDLARVRKELSAEFPGGEEEYHAWFLITLGIAGDPVAGRQAIKAAVAAGTKTVGNAYGYDRAFTRSPTLAETTRIARLAALRAALGDRPVVLDPFAGGGSIPFEAARYGCESVANELNPVAAAILTGTVDLPFRLGPDFAGTIRRWGTEWGERVRHRLEPYFPIERVDERLAYIWAHTVPCPATGLPTPLAPDYWLARGKAGRDVAIALEADFATGRVSRRVVEGAGAREWGERPTYKSGTGTSIWTGQTFDAKYIVGRAQAGEMGEMLLAVSVTRPGHKGRQFRAPSDADLAAVEAARAEVDRRLPGWEVDDLVPNELRFIGPADRSARYGIRAARQMFTPRQLLTTATALEELHAVVAEARHELSDEEARALGLYLAFALDKSVDYNGMLSSWHASRTTVRNVFDRHDFSFKWSFAEFDGAHALLPWAVEQVADAYGGIAKLARERYSLRMAEDAGSSVVRMGSAADLSGIESSSVDAVITDPPYYDNVMYGECSDYFLVWLRRSLRDTWPQFCHLSSSDKETEAVANSSLFEAVAPSARGRRQKGAKTASDLADEHYEDLLTRSFAEANRVLKDDGVMTVMFTHKRVDAWDTLGQALLGTGFSVASSWPVHTESEHSLHQAKKNAASSTILLTCHKRASTRPAYWADIRGEVAEAARDAVERFSAAGLHGIDLTLSTFGPVLSVLSQNWPVYTGALDADGDPEVIRPDVALDLARSEVATLKKRGLLGGRDVEFDRVTDWWLLAWADFAAAEFPAGEALKLSLATHLDLDELSKSHRVIRATSGTVTMLTPTQRRTAKALDPAASSWPTMLDGLHALMLVYDEEGAGAARAWLTRTGNGDNPRFRDLVTAALHAVPRTRDNGEFVRPEARSLEGIRVTLFDDLPAPPEPSLPSDGQGTFFDDRPEETGEAEQDGTGADDDS